MCGGAVGGALRALCALWLLGCGARGRPLEGRRRPGSQGAPGGPRDLRALPQAVQRDLLRGLNLSGVPAQPRARAEPPQYMLDLYHRYASDKAAAPASNVVRSFSVEGTGALGAGGPTGGSQGAFEGAQ